MSKLNYPHTSFTLPSSFQPEPMVQTPGGEEIYDGEVMDLLEHGQSDMTRESHEDLWDFLQRKSDHMAASNKHYNTKKSRWRTQEEKDALFKQLYDRSSYLTDTIDDEPK